MRAVCVFVALWAGVVGGRASAGEPIVELRVSTIDGKFRLSTPAHTAKRFFDTPTLFAGGPRELALRPDLVTVPAIAGPLGMFHDLDTKASGRGLLTLHLEL
jgi:hypothetical protein